MLDRSTGIKMEQWKDCSFFIFPWGCCVSIVMQLNLSYEIQRVGEVDTYMCI